MKINKMHILAIIFLIILHHGMNRVYGFGLIQTPAIEGKIIDEITGNPIANVVVAAAWEKWQIGILDQQLKIEHDETVITDKEGRFKISGYKGMMVLSRFRGITIEAIHPLYINKYFGWDEEAFKRLKRGEKEGYYSIDYKENPTQPAPEGIPIGKLERLYGTYENGTIHYDIKLVGVEEAIRRGAEEYEKTKDWHKAFNLKSYISTYSGLFFKDHWDKRFVESILIKWEEIANRHGGFNSSELREFNRIKKEVEDVYHGEK